MAMGEKSIEASLVELSTILGGVREAIDGVGSRVDRTNEKVDRTTEEVIGLKHQIKAVDELRSEFSEIKKEHKKEIDEIKKHAADQDAKLTKLLAYVAIAAVVASALISGFASGIGRNLVSKEEVAAAAPTKKVP